MSEREHLKEIDQVLSGRSIGRDGFVTQSWRRCVEQYGMDPTKPSPAHIVTESRLREHVEHSERLIAIARSGLDALFRQIAGRNYVLLLADAKGVTVDYFGDPQFEDELRRAGLYLGSDWSEDVAGTCGVGSCIVTEQAITVHQSDHFDLTHTPLSCTAAPIFDMSGKLAAVLDISLLRSPQPKISQRLALSMVTASARRVEMANLMAESRDEWVLRFSTSPEFLDVDPEAAVTLDGSGRIIGMTRGASRLFATAQTPLIGQRIDQFLDISIDNLPDLMRDRPTQDRLISLRDGQALFGHAIAPQKARMRLPPEAENRPPAFRNLCGEDPAMLALIADAAQLALAQVPLLICGETGTGKESIARAIHMTRGGAVSFQRLNCTASPLPLPAPDGRTDGGTIFIDNLDALDITGQGALLDWLLQIEMLAPSSRPRFIAVASEALLHEVSEGRFRKDLFFRLAAARLTLPALRQRQDIDWLIDRILRRVGHARPNTLKLSPAARAALKARHWPGNLRELAQTLEVAAVLAIGDVIDEPDLPPAPLQAASQGETLAQVLAVCNGNMSDAARRLGVNRSTVLRRARREGLLR
ncbi:MAG: sigma-54-dependent Fis family transcriptional regulator [Rhodobacteraceae bacterium]|nr:MAG: sigma-54-dependent Fis family transcriptional regulator [Paracoccaceae bacterium]